MTQTLELMRRRIESAEDLYAVVRVMKALAAASIRQCERAVESLAEYNHTIEAGLQIILRSQPEAIAAAESPLGRRWGFIVFGSDQGMCGSFNEQVATFALEQLDTLSDTQKDRTVLVVGSRVVGRLEDAGCTVGERFPMPSTVSGITSAVDEVLLKVEELRFQTGIDQFLIVHHRPSAPAGSWPRKLQLLPIDRAWLRSLATRSWASRSLPTFTMDWRRLFSALIRQYLFVMLYRAFAESLASENASRLASMHAAEKNIQSHLSRLTVAYHQGRQQSITEELLDIVAGFETLTKQEGQKADREAISAPRFKPADNPARPA
jgi:F-type H+-transporting ATPase subunit gamma